MKNSLNINVLVSEDYDMRSLPQIVETFKSHGHDVDLVDIETQPTSDRMLDCDVLIDRSSCTDNEFYNNLSIGYFKRRAIHKEPVPLMVDNPFAIMTSFDKRRTNMLFSDLIPETYNLDGINNEEMIQNFKGDEFVVVKDPFGWSGNGVERLSPEEATTLYSQSPDLIIQKYIPSPAGIGRVYTLNYEADFEIMCNYVVTPDIWRTGIGSNSIYTTKEVNEDLERFAKHITKTSGLYLNAIDYIETETDTVLLEINAVPNLNGPKLRLGIDTFAKFVGHVERNAMKSYS